MTARRGFGRRLPRRSLLALLLSAPLSAALPGCSRRRTSPLADRVETMLSRLGAAQRLGQLAIEALGSRPAGEWLSMALGERGLAQLAAAESSAAAARAAHTWSERMAADFQAGETVQVDGWLLARSEAALFAYAAADLEQVELALPQTGAKRPTPAQLRQRGEALYRSSGCGACHDLERDKPTGPALAGRAGSPVRLSDGTRKTRDARYLRAAIENPAAEVVEGYTPSMPALGLGDDDLDALVAYIESLR